MARVNIKGISKAKVLVALYNGSVARGMGNLQATSEPLTLDKAEKLLRSGSYFDYLQGRVMKVDLEGNMLDTVLYDRDLGRGHGEEVIAKLRTREGDIHG